MQIHCQSIQHEAKIMKDDAVRQTAQALGVKARRLKGQNVFYRPAELRTPVDMIARGVIAAVKDRIKQRKTVGMGFAYRTAKKLLDNCRDANEPVIMRATEFKASRSWVYRVLISGGFLSRKRTKSRSTDVEVIAQRMIKWLWFVREVIYKRNHVEELQTPAESEREREREREWDRVSISNISSALLCSKLFELRILLNPVACTPVLHSIVAERVQARTTYCCLC